jgi:D-alanyl-D-alanine dipeptidase
MPHPLVPVDPVAHGVVLDLVYATPQNITGKPIYARPMCLMHRDAQKCLHQAALGAMRLGLRLKIFDAFRPHEAQVLLWDAAPDKAYVADPAIGSNHTRGVAVDLTMVDAGGLELDMGTAFDDMTALSHHFSDKVSPEAQANRMHLLTVMEDAGFEHIPHEWWHYALPGADHYPLVPSTHLGHLNPMLPL